MSAGVGADVVLHLLSSVVRNLIPVFAGWIVTSPAAARHVRSPVVAHGLQGCGCHRVTAGKVALNPGQHASPLWDYYRRSCRGTAGETDDLRVTGITRRDSVGQISDPGHVVTH